MKYVLNADLDSDLSITNVLINANFPAKNVLKLALLFVLHALVDILLKMKHVFQI